MEANGRLWSKISDRKLKNFISYSMIMLVPEPDTVLSKYIMYLGSQYNMYSRDFTKFGIKVL